MSRIFALSTGKFFLLLPLLFNILFPPLDAQQNRDQIPERYKWNLSDIYASPDLWLTEKEQMHLKIETLGQFQGTLAQSPQQLHQALTSIFSTWRTLDKLYVYAYLQAIQDLRQSGPQALLTDMDGLYSRMGGKLSYFEPEILSIPLEVLQKALATNPELEPYRSYILDIHRLKPHTLTADQEWIINRAGTLSGLAGKVHDLMTAAELPWGSMKGPGGESILLDIPGYERQRNSPDPAHRLSAFTTFYTSLGQFRALFSTLLSGKIKENLFYRDVRKYQTVLDMYLLPRKIPKEVFTGMIDAVNSGLPTLHRYLRLKKRVLGLDTLHYHDLYPEWLAGVDLQFTYEQAQTLLLASLKPLGPQYTTFLNKAFAERWLDVYPYPGKISGASCEGSYDTHPFVKLNYNDRYGDVCLAAHELGHAVHSCLANRAQAYPLASANSLIAETAATVNESLL